MKGLRELYPSIHLVLPFDFAEAFVCFVGFLSGESAVSVADLIKGRAIDEATIPVKEEVLVDHTMILKRYWLGYTSQG